MKNTLLILTLTMSFIGYSQRSDSSKLKLNSFEVEVFGGGLYHQTKDYSNFIPFYKNESDFQSVLEGDSIIQNHNYSGKGTSDFSGVGFYAGFNPYSKKKNQYSLNQEVRIGIGYSSFYAPNWDKSYQTITTIDTLLTYSISEATGDTLNFTKEPIDSVNSHYESYLYFKNKVMIMGEWDYKFNPTNRLVLSLGGGARISYLFGGYNYYSYLNNYRLTNQFEDTYNYSNSISTHNYNTEIIKNWSNESNQNGVAFEPYLKGNMEFKLGMKDNFISHLSINTKGFIGGSIHKIFNVNPVISEMLYGGSLGLKYRL